MVPIVTQTQTQRMKPCSNVTSFSPFLSVAPLIFLSFCNIICENKQPILKGRGQRCKKKTLRVNRLQPRPIFCICVCIPRKHNVKVDFDVDADAKTNLTCEQDLKPCLHVTFVFAPPLKFKIRVFS